MPFTKRSIKNDFLMFRAKFEPKMRTCSFQLVKCCGELYVPQPLPVLLENTAPCPDTSRRVDGEGRSDFVGEIAQKISQKLRTKDALSKRQALDPHTSVHLSSPESTASLVRSPLLQVIEPPAVNGRLPKNVTKNTKNSPPPSFVPSLLKRIYL